MLRKVAAQAEGPTDLDWILPSSLTRALLLSVVELLYFPLAYL